MAIAAAFQCADGVLLVADSKHNVGDASYPGQKLWEIQCGGFGSSLVVTGAGVDSAILDAVNSPKDDQGIDADSISFGTIEGAIRRCGFGKDSTLLIGVKIRSEQPARLLRVEEGDEGKVRTVPFSSVSDELSTSSPRSRSVAATTSATSWVEPYRVAYATRTEADKVSSLQLGIHVLQLALQRD